MNKNDRNLGELIFIDAPIAVGVTALAYYGFPFLAFAIIFLLLVCD